MNEEVTAIPTRMVCFCIAIVVQGITDFRGSVGLCWTMNTQTILSTLRCPTRADTRTTGLANS